MCEESGGRKTEQRRRRRRKGGVGGGRCGEAGASVYSQTGCFGILSPGLTGILNMADLALHSAHKETKPHARTHIYTHIYTQPSRLPPAPPAKTQQGSLSVGTAPFEPWANSLLHFLSSLLLAPSSSSFIYFYFPLPSLPLFLIPHLLSPFAPSLLLPPPPSSSS